MKKISIFVLLIVAVSVVFAVSIYDVQYTENPGIDELYPSPYEGQTVTLEGVVTGVLYAHYEDNIYIQMPDGGAWSGIYVYACGDSSLAVGDMVSVTGPISEYYGLTELGFATDVTVLSHGNPLPAPVIATTEDMASNEAYEGVLVELRDVFVSAEPTDYGEWYVVDTSQTPCQIDDGFFYLDSVDPEIVITIYDNWAAVRGIVTYSYDDFQLEPRFAEDLIRETSTDEPFITPVSSLTGNHPNPFNPETTIDYNLVEDAFVNIAVYNIKGEKVNNLVNSHETAGNHQVTWTGTDFDGNTVTSGVYFYMLNDNTTEMKKMILLK